VQVRSFLQTLAGITLLACVHGAAAAENAPLVLNLLSSVTPIEIGDHPLPEGVDGYRIYTTEFVKGGTRWYRLRLGLFQDNKAARSVVAKLRSRYPSVWVDRATAEEIAAAGAPVAEVKETVAPPPRAVAVPVAVTTADTTPPTGAGLVINLLSALTPVNAADHAVPEALAGYRRYVVEYDKSGRRWYRLRLGIFRDRKQATAALAQLRAAYPSAWIESVSAADRVAPEESAPSPIQLASSSQIARDAIEADKRYVINLAASTKPLPTTTVPELASVRSVHTYATETERRGDRWYFLRAGFFATRAEAEALLPKVLQNYPDARVMKITRYELAQATGVEQAPAKTTASPATKNGNRSALLEAARLAMVKGNYDQAVLLYQKAIDEGDAATAREAQELLGLAHERRGDMVTARKEYERFLELYPEGEDAERVRQRLIAIDTSRADLKASLREAKKREAPAQYLLYGSLSAIYRRDADISDENGDVVSQSALTTYFDATGRVRSGAYDSRLRVTGSHRSDFLDNGPGDDNRLSTFYLDVLNKEKDWSLRLGRQSSSSGGVLGRFDGIYGGMRLTPQLRLNAVAGYPVATSADTSVNDKANFVGVSADLSGLVENWEFQLYGIQQRAEGYIDRTAVGGEARYFQPGRTFFGLLDYDTHYQQLNTAMMLGTWSMNDATSFNLLYDRRMSPTLSTSNALQGQTVTTLDALAQTYTTEQIEQLALDRTAESQTVMAGVAHTLNERYQVTADLTATEVGDTPASGNVLATPSSGTEYYLSTQLIGRNLFWPDDISILGLRLGNSRTIDSAAVFINSRLNNGPWQLNPRIQVEYRDDKSNDFSYWTLKPSLLASYRRWKDHTLEGEVGSSLTTRSEVPQSYYFSLSYRWDFN
jgi:tetratricopeptide (TPR) repeat protein